MPPQKTSTSLHQPLPPQEVTAAEQEKDWIQIHTQLLVVITETLCSPTELPVVTYIPVAVLAVVQMTA